MDQSDIDRLLSLPISKKKEKAESEVKEKTVRKKDNQKLSDKNESDRIARYAREEEEFLSILSSKKK